MLKTGQIMLIDKIELIDMLMRSDCSSREKVIDIVDNQPVIAVAKHKYEVEIF